MKAEGGGKRFAVRILVAIVVLLVLLVVVLGLALETASADPYGMATARPLTVSDVSKIEPLYGDVWTPNAAVSWSPDGRFVAVGGGFTAGVAILDAFSGRIVRTWSVPGDIYVLRWSPDGRRLAVGNELGFVQSPGWVYIYTPDGFLQDSWQAHSWFVGGLAWSPNGTEIVTTSNVRYAIWDVATHSRLWLDTNASTWGDSVDWSPDGHLLAFGSNAGPSIYDAVSHERLYQPPSVEWDQRGVAWSHSGARIAAANLDGCATVLSRSGQTLWSYNDTAGAYGCSQFAGYPAWDPTDQMLAVPTPAGIRIFDAADGVLLRTLAFPVDRYAPSTITGNYGEGNSRDLASAWSPAGEAIASVGTMSHPSFRVWGLPHGSVASGIAAFEFATVAGIPLALGRDFLTLLVRPSECLASEAKRSRLLLIGSVLLLFAFVVAVLQQTALEFLGRAFGGFVIPPPSWFAVTAILSCALAVIPVAVSVRVFQAVAWKTPRESGATLRIAAKVQGLALLPVVWCLALGCLALSIALAFGVEDSPVLGATLIALFGGVGVLLATGIVSATSGATFYRSVLALLAVAGVTIGLSFAEFLAVVALLSIVHFVPTGDLAAYGIRIQFGFGIAPWIASVLALAVIGVGAVLTQSAPAFLAPLYSRLRVKSILDLQSRRQVLDYLGTHPGVHFRELLRSLPLGSGNLYYHLQVLEREGLIVARRDGMYRRFFLHPTSEAKIPPGTDRS